MPEPIFAKPAAQLLRDLEQGLSLPAFWYTDPAMLELEQEQIFRKSWQYIGRLDQLQQTGDYVTGYVGDIPVVVVKNSTGIEGFVNVCRHRRHEVMQGCGSAKIMQCAYHAWTYDLNGCLKSAPRADREKNFDPTELPLLKVRTDTLGPFVFVNIDMQARPIVEFFAPVLDMIALSGIDLAKLEFRHREDWQGGANWKTKIENYLECYHCPVQHPGFTAVIDVDPDTYKLTEHEWFSSQTGPVRSSAVDGTSKQKLEYNAIGTVTQARYFLLWPNFTININPGAPNLSIDVWLPDGPCATRGFSEYFFAPDAPEQFATDLMAFSKKVGNEDDLLTDSVQRGLKGGRPAQGRFLIDSEHLIVHFQKLLLKALAQP